MYGKCMGNIQKLSTLPDGGNYNSATDKIPTIRNGGVSGTDYQTVIPTSGGTSIGVINKLIAKVVTSPIYTTGVTTFAAGSPGVFTSAAAAIQALPTGLHAGQVFYVDFPQANPGAANYVVGALAAKPIKVIDAYGNILTLVGGEIVKGPAWLYYDGVQFIYSVPVSDTILVTGATAVTQQDFTAGNAFCLISGNETLTLPLSTTLSPNGRIYVFSVDGIATIALTSPDQITKNGTTGSSTTKAQGADLAMVVTDGNGNFYVSGA
jgi:hypothetical protein